MNNIDVPINVKLSGEVTIEVFNTKKQEVTYRHTGKNMILDSVLNGMFGEYPERRRLCQSVNLVPDAEGFINTSSGPFGEEAWCRVGSGTTPSTRSMTDMETNITNKITGSSVVEALARPESSKQAPNDYSAPLPFWTERYFVFEAGQIADNTGSVFVGEVGLWTREQSNFYDYLLCRQILNPGVTISSDDELRVTWRINYWIPRSFSGTIVGGNLNGGDVDWTYTLNNEQFSRFLRDQWLTSFLRTGSSVGQACIFSESNDPTDFANDEEFTVKGTNIYNFNVSLTPYPYYKTEPTPAILRSTRDYVLGEYYNELTVGLEHDEPSDVTIGDFVLAKGLITSPEDECYGRVTFDPPLTKDTQYRVFLTFRFTVDEYNVQP